VLALEGLFVSGRARIVLRLCRSVDGQRAQHRQDNGGQHSLEFHRRLPFPVR
jgi:hypothetical protein